LSDINEIRKDPMTTRLISSFVKSAPIYIGIMVIVLNDWRLGNFSFSDLFILFGILMLLPSITKIPVRWLVGCITVIVIVLTNVFVASISGGYSITSGVFYLAKIAMYIMFYVLLYYYVIKHHMVLNFINALISVAVVVSLIGLYISLIIATNSNLPYDFLWTFTRQDIASYVFAGGYSNVVRLRSIFGEPQHLGLFLNITLVSALLGNYSKYIHRNRSLILIALAAFMTFSFSTIPVTLVILLIYFIQRHKLSFFLKKNFIMIIVIISSLSVLMWQPINETIFQRGALILDGSDGSAYQRIIGSWSFINQDNIIFGSGVGASPYVWNNYAYLVMDLGVVGLLIGLAITYVLLRRNIYVGLMFIIFCSQKGGYLSGFFLVMLMIAFFISSKTNASSKYVLGLQTNMPGLKVV